MCVFPNFSYSAFCPITDKVGARELSGKEDIFGRMQPQSSWCLKYFIKRAIMLFKNVSLRDKKYWFPCFFDV